MALPMLVSRSMPWLVGQIATYLVKNRQARCPWPSIVLCTGSVLLPAKKVKVGNLASWQRPIPVSGASIQHGSDRTFPSPRMARIDLPSLTETALIDPEKPWKGMPRRDGHDTTGTGMGRVMHACLPISKMTPDLSTLSKTGKQPR